MIAFHEIILKDSLRDNFAKGQSPLQTIPGQGFLVERGMEDLWNFYNEVSSSL